MRGLAVLVLRLRRLWGQVLPQEGSPVGSALCRLDQTEVQRFVNHPLLLLVLSIADLAVDFDLEQDVGERLL